MLGKAYLWQASWPVYMHNSLKPVSADFDADWYEPALDASLNAHSFKTGEIKLSS